MTEFDPHNYTITIKRVVEDGEHLFLATVKELPHVAEYGDSFDEVYELALDAINVLRDMASEMGHQFPEPLIEDETFSGRVTLRMPKSLHRSVAAIADGEGVSLNQFLVTTIAERVGTGNLYTSLVGRLEKRLVSGTFTTAVRDFALAYTDAHRFFGSVKNIPVKETATTSEQAPINLIFGEDNIFTPELIKHG